MEAAAVDLPTNKNRGLALVSAVMGWPSSDGPGNPTATFEA